MDLHDIVVLTGTRAEYGLLKSSMEAIRGHDSLSLSVVATGMHLSPTHGRTVTDIRRDGFDVDREVLMLFDGDDGTAMAKSLGVGTQGLADAFDSLDPDAVLLLGDRDEALAGALAASHMNIPVAHIHGGDTMRGATIDDSIRHAITKFAHLHFPATESSAERIRKLGEEPWRITTVGAPAMDAILADDFEQPEAVRNRFDIPEDDPFILIVQHPVTTEPDSAAEQMRTTLDAVSGFEGTKLVVYPNADAGGKRIIDLLESRASKMDLRTIESVPRRTYLGLLATADVLVGNSSSGIIESPAFDLPVVDVGPRQDGRERAENVLSVPHDVSAIRDAVDRCLTDPTVLDLATDCKNPYDAGGTASRIVDRLASLDRDRSTLLRKQLTY